MRKSKILMLICSISAIILLLCSCGASNENEDESSPVIMGSVVTIQTYTDNKQKTKSVKSNMIEEIKRVDLVISKNNQDSELYKINQKSGEENVISAELYNYIWDTTDIYSLSENRLSVTSGALTELWGIDTEDFKLPTAEAIEKAIPLCNDSNISATEQDLGVSIKVEKGQVFNLGSVGKGIACEKAIEVAKNNESVLGAVVSVGGSVGVFGTHEGKDIWTVGIRDPYASSSDLFATLNVKESFISTSGNYEKKFEIDGKTYHHILDLETGYPVENDLVAVTVVARTGLESDAFSTMCYVLGEEKSVSYLKMYGAEAVFVYADKTVSVTDGLKNSFEITNDQYTLK